MKNIVFIGFAFLLLILNIKMYSRHKKRNRSEEYFSDGIIVGIWIEFIALKIIELIIK